MATKDLGYTHGVFVPKNPYDVPMKNSWIDFEPKIRMTRPPKLAIYTQFLPSFNVETVSKVY